MFSLHSVSSFLLLITYSIAVSAAPCSEPAPAPQPGVPRPFDSSVEIPPVTPEQVLAIAPGSSCAATPFPPQECHNNVIAAQRLNEGFDTFNLKSLGQKAAMISYMAFESADFTANINHFPGRPGQGTKCMLSFPGIYQYAASFPENRNTIAQNSPGGVVMQQVPFDQFDALFTPQQQMNIRQLVLGEDRTFGSAMWFTKNEPDCAGIQAAEVLRTNGEQGWRTWNSQCLFIGQGDADRAKRWCGALKVLAPQGMQLPAVCNNVPAQR